MSFNYPIGYKTPTATPQKPSDDLDFRDLEMPIDHCSNEDSDSDSDFSALCEMIPSHLQSYCEKIRVLISRIESVSNAQKHEDERLSKESDQFNRKMSYLMGSHRKQSEKYLETMEEMLDSVQRLERQCRSSNPKLVSVVPDYEEVTRKRELSVERKNSLLFEQKLEEYRSEQSKSTSQSSVSKSVGGASLDVRSTDYLHRRVECLEREVSLLRGVLECSSCPDSSIRKVKSLILKMEQEVPNGANREQQALLESDRDEWKRRYHDLKLENSKSAVRSCPSVNLKNQLSFHRGVSNSLSSIPPSPILPEASPAPLLFSGSSMVSPVSCGASDRHQWDRERESYQSRISNLERSLAASASASSACVPAAKGGSSSSVSAVSSEMVSSLRSELERSRSCQESAEASVRSLESVRSELESRVKSLESALSSERGASKSASAGIESKQKELESEISRLRQEKSKLESRLKSDSSTHKIRENELEKLSKELESSLESVKEEVKQKENDLKELQKSHKQELKELQKKMEESGNLFALYSRVKEENRKLFNTIQELKGNIRVFCRIRPMVKDEMDRHDESAILKSSPSDLHIRNTKGTDKIFSFSEVFDVSATNEVIFRSVEGLITSVLDGYNACIFAYGQTGSGKTYTMEGTRRDPGINHRALQLLFNRIRSMENQDVSFQSSVLEIYNEQVRDLLVKESKSLGIKTVKGRSEVPDLSRVEVKSYSEVSELLDRGKQNRSTASNNMNLYSSRSHLILTVEVQVRDRTTKRSLKGKLNLVDLVLVVESQMRSQAGSERVSRTGAEGDRLEELKSINSSLTFLGNVISELSNKQSHISYRNSALTLLLQDSLSRDSKTLMVVQISPSLVNSDESFCSLNFAQHVMSVELGSKRISPHFAACLPPWRQRRSNRRTHSDLAAPSVSLDPPSSSH